ncbi:MAG: hypothetical protein FJ290_16875, partial [Planctomycetes bacterium]|nr:hypothetical protein [Planctomycetota bacterium]
MKIELKEFQVTAVEKVLTHLANARREARDGTAQAIILSSPTGSGKTVTLTALLEAILEGQEPHPPDPEAVFLWLSDSPQLNEQSRDKILAQSSVFRPHELIIVQPPFPYDRLEPGNIYFLNTQKLSRDSLLTREGEGRPFTIWQTIENTSRDKPDHLYMVIDEAHRGMERKAREKSHTPIMQRFIFGDPQVGLSPVKLVLGMSATPQRFAHVIQGSGRTCRPYDVPVADVQRSGLLKDLIIAFCYEGGHEADWTLLAESGKRWKRFCDDWRKYCREQGIPTLEPVLVVQVEDGTEDKPTRTDLARAIEVLERETRKFGLNEVAHCFEIESGIQAGGHPICKIEPSKIQQDPHVRVVFFKMALSLGWDCPRAEVMMSFRRAQDHTSIAQLVGRMVRTPLARSIEGNELLNTVSLYLPHYDKAGLDAIVSRLNDPENAPPSEVKDGSQLVELHKDPRQAAAFELLATLPSYSVERVPKSTDTKRFIKLARQLAFDKIHVEAWPEAKELVMKTLFDELKRAKEMPLFAKKFRKNQTLEVREVHIETGEWKRLDDGRTIKIKATTENIESLFAECGRMLGEGLHYEFVKRHAEREDPDKARLELYGLLHDDSADSSWQRIERTAARRIDELWAQFGHAINVLPSGRLEEYRKIARAAREPQTVPLTFEDPIMVDREEPPWPRHVYVDEKGVFGWKANGWEAAVLQEELNDESVVAWLRNFPRKPRSLCVPYQFGGQHKGLYPDLVVFRRVGDRLVMDILAPNQAHYPKECKSGGCVEVPPGTQVPLTGRAARNRMRFWASRA